jgi:hypothetical protein
VTDHVRELSRKLEALAYVMLDLEDQLKYLVKKLDPTEHPAYMEYATHALGSARARKTEDRQLAYELTVLKAQLNAFGFDPKDKEPACTRCAVPLNWTKAHDKLVDDCEAAVYIRQEMAALVGDQGMEEWLQCTACVATSTT